MASMDGPAAKLNRANEHLEELTDEVARAEQAIRDTGGRIELDAQYEPASQSFKVLVAKTPEVPVRIGVLAGEVIYNLRCALDYLMYELVALENGGVYDEKTQFPIADDADRFNGPKAASINKHTLSLIPNRVADVERHQPYGSLDEIRRIYGLAWPDDAWQERIANRQLRFLRELSNRDKHRLLIRGFVLADQVQLVPIPQRDCREPVRQLYVGSALIEGALVAHYRVTPTGPDPHMDVLLNVVPEMGIPFGPAIPTLQAIFTKVTQVVGEFEPLF